MLRIREAQSGAAGAAGAVGRDGAALTCAIKGGAGGVGTAQPPFARRAAGQHPAERTFRPG